MHLCYFMVIEQVVIVICVKHFDHISWRFAFFQHYCTLSLYLASSYIQCCTKCTCFYRYILFDSLFNCSWSIFNCSWGIYSQERNQLNFIYVFDMRSDVTVVAYFIVVCGEAIENENNCLFYFLYLIY